jgi:hypothetical protein
MQRATAARPKLKRLDDPETLADVDLHRLGAIRIVDQPQRLAV